MTKYLLDTNIYISFYDRYYKYNFFPSFWSKFETIINECIIIPKIVVNEQTQNEWFKDWLRNNYTESIYDHKKYFSEWSNILSSIAENPVYNDGALTSDNGWAHEKIADPWIIAIAKIEGLTLVTEERKHPHLNPAKPSGSVKIPDICKDFNVRCITMNEFFEEIKFKI
ncbi:DUF4411 family protein [Listeria monocytogenes]|uniref:DUF4411 family protein n=1 Tax=Listeria monocytogenes TaxID=1639 RepID=A0AB37NS72_LISMN|nr:DUF4411 family protein [Listeria monocytogenes]EAC7024830.1 DUF4411 family protein [Listeria monocytogenes]EAD0695912.1 DUF4411 family protein [Listeria monocytogenes]EAD1105789.1 DUF4411 family protein [Listeria monocytogenes]EAG1939846.1 DUF4411 family protein [Listeria monocytogenes]EBF5184249.1 DUF4411 family protein [Listeria monocytogenes]